MNRCRCLIAAAAVVVLLPVTSARALINPRFTPVHLVEEAALIVWVDVEQGESKDQYTAAIREVLKGKTELKSFPLDLSRARDPQSAGILRELADAGKPALFFVGEFEDAEDGSLEDDDPVVPVADGVSWSEGPLKVVTLDGKINAVRPIDLVGDGKFTETLDLSGEVAYASRRGGVKDS